MPPTSSIDELQDFFPKDYVWRAMASADELRALNLEDHERIREAFGRHKGSERAPRR